MQDHDYIHHHRYNWAHVDFIEAARKAGFRACDCIIKIRSGPIIDPKWKNAYHTRRQHSYWLVFRRSSSASSIGMGTSVRNEKIAPSALRQTKSST